jgi:S-adenosylmethionine:tRNA ribosyltransferase-isomerase
VSRSNATALTFDLPPELDAHVPPEERGLARDAVRMMVARRRDLSLANAWFRDLPEFLESGDLLVINTSATLPASLPARRDDGTELELHLSTPVPTGSGPVDLEDATAAQPWTWVVELRRVEGGRSRSYRTPALGETLVLPGGGRAEILAPYPPDCGPSASDPGPSRLWGAALRLPAAVGPYLRRFGRPIQYDRSNEWPVSAYQTVFAVEPGSAEMPSAGRAFTPEVLTALIARGVDVAPVTLHTGVSSLEDHEPPYAEFFRVSEETARRIEVARGSGGRVVAVGTTAVRAVESAVHERGAVVGAEGWTELVITPETGVRVVGGLLTGWHEPRASHLLMLEAIAGRELLERSYREAVAERYLWHEFGDLHLILP